MKNNFIVNINNISEIDSFKKVGISTFLFALKDFCIGYEKEYDIDEINSINEQNKYILINRMLDCLSVDELKVILKKLKNIKGIFFEDIAVYQIVNELKIDIELICFQNHFNSNVGTVNFWLDRVDSVVICNELTLNEIKYITANAKKNVVLQVYGYNQAMYSRRLLLTNFAKEFNLDKRNKNILTEKVSGIKFRALENKYGTVLYSGEIFNGFELLNLDNVKFFYINTTMIEHKDIIRVLNGEVLSSNDGFLNRETIYKLKGANKNE